MSLFTRIVGFALCVIGAFIAGYYQALHSVGNTISGIVLSYATAGVPSSFYPDVIAQINTYIQQSVTPVWQYGLAIGAAIAIGGIIVVARGDGKPPVWPSQIPPQEEPITVKQRE